MAQPADPPVTETNTVTAVAAAPTPPPGPPRFREGSGI